MQVDQYASEGAHIESHQASPAGESGVQTMVFFFATYAFGHAENIADRNPIAALHGGIADRENPICSDPVNNATMHYYSPANLVEYSVSAENVAVNQRPDKNAVPVADGRIHARSGRFEGDGRALLEQCGDDGLNLGHGGDGFRMEKV